LTTLPNKKNQPAMTDKMQIFTFLFLMLGPFKIIIPFARITMDADPEFTRKLAVRALFYSCLALLLAGILGHMILTRFGIPIPILGLSGGIILFLVALLSIIQQFTLTGSKDDKVVSPTMSMAISPLAFPTIVTPYGIAAVIVFLAFSPDLNSKLTIGAIVLIIMVLNLIVMLITRYIFKPLAVFLAVLGAILAVVQVALGLMIINNQLRVLLKL
jgi:multiple antibiotic resistance protein